MKLSVRTFRNATFVVLLLASAVGIQRRVLAASCESMSSNWDTASIDNCGPYEYSTDPIVDMRSKIGAYVVNYNWGGGVYQDPFWWVRLTPFEEDAYYSSAWAVCPTSGWCW